MPSAQHKNISQQKIIKLITYIQTVLVLQDSEINNYRQITILPLQNKIKTNSLREFRIINSTFYLKSTKE